MTEIPTSHRPRATGVGKYGFSRFAKGFLDLLTVLVLTHYRWRPMHVIGVAGMTYALAAILGIGCLGLAYALAPGLILIAIGLTAELIVASRPMIGLYTVTGRVGWCAAAPE